MDNQGIKLTRGSFDMKSGSERKDDYVASMSSPMQLRGVGTFRTKEGQAAEFIRERIISGELTRGQKLKQVELANMLNLSVTPVREALKLLEAEGYVTGSSHRGAVVSQFQVERIDELYELRSLLESRLTLEAAKRITPQAITMLAKINKEMMTALNRNDLAAVRSANFRFHFSFYEMADQPQTLHFVRILWAKYPFDLLAVMPNRQVDVIKEHQQFLETLAAGDSKAVVKSMRAHLESGHRGFKTNYVDVARQG
jgi:DNA-binding GntR family transcriptional regulator